jgi:hypothetical protein
MKNFISILLLSATLTNAPGLSHTAWSSPRNISLKDVAEHVRTENFRVYENALRVYQAKESIQAARMNLLPKLNLWRLAGAAADTILGMATGGATYGSVITMVTDLAPFLIPANWFAADEAKLFYLAENEGYRALWANELLTAKMVYFHLALDRALLQHILRSEHELDELVDIVKTREKLGGLPQSVSRDLEIRKLALQEDARSLNFLLLEEENQLSFLMGMPAGTSLVLEEVPLTDPERLEPLNFHDFEFRVTDTAPELRQYDHFIEIADLIRKEIQYSIFGISSISRGVAGGIFDSIPLQDGLGFGTPASMRITAAQKELLKTQKKGSAETLLRHLKILVDTYNLDLENHSLSKKRLELTAAAKQQLFERLRLGQEVDVIDLAEASRNQIQAETSSFALKFRIAANSDKLRRLLFQDDYAKAPVLIDSLGGAK